jgi:hypothetical protein
MAGADQAEALLLPAARLLLAEVAWAAGNLGETLKAATEAVKCLIQEALAMALEAR